MTVEEAIHSADVLYPNRYSMSEKLRWCYEVTAAIRNEIKKIYDFVVTDEQHLRETLDRVGFDRVESLITGSRTRPKTDVRTWYNNGQDILPPDFQGAVKVVYLTEPEPYRYVKYAGNGRIREGVLILPESCDLRTGDTIDICYGEQEATFPIIGDSSGYYLGDDTIDFAGELSLEKRMNEPLECEAPYDYMYVDFLLGKICYYQNDYDNYNQHMAQYNNKISMYQRWRKERDVYGSIQNLRNFWS